MVLGIGLLVGYVVHVSGPGPIASNPVSPRRSAVDPKTEFVGRITGMVDCQWADPQTAVPGPVAVPLGRSYALASGLMEITYDSGAKVILQGPCTYQVESPASGFLSVGKLTARVEKNDECRMMNDELRTSQNGIHHSSFITHPLFSVRTPTAIVTDLGTEFGVEVAESGDTSAHVFDGVVELTPIGCGVEQNQAVRLFQNESARVEKDGNGNARAVRSSDSAPAAFVRAGQVPKLAEELKLKPFRRWQAHSEELRRDPSLVAYYDFQSERGRPDVLRNVAANGDRLLDGVIENATWTTGRMPGKQAIFFDGAESHVKVNLPLEMTRLTLATWITIDGIDPGRESCALIASDGWDGPEPKCNWQIAREGEIHFDTKSRFCDTTPSVLPAIARNPGRWRHLAVVADASEQRVTHYLDGKAIYTGTIPKEFVAVFGSAQIGNWRSMDGKDKRGFHGRMDELMIFGRAMTQQEIEELYTNGKR